MVDLNSWLLQGKCPSDHVGNWAQRACGRVLKGMLVVKLPIIVV